MSLLALDVRMTIRMVCVGHQSLENPDVVG
jgi:hypothetical protein